LAVKADFDCRFVGTITLIWRFTVNKIIAQLRDFKNLARGFRFWRVFVAVIQASREIFVFENSPQDFKPFCSLVTE